ncbi:MAG: glycosyltransferase [Acidobacteriota bacterium]|nr:glycosyltransferase [Acidobacteriota bacterium]
MGALRVLAVTNMYPTESRPDVGTFVHQQIEGLKRLGLEVEVLHMTRSHAASNAKAGPFLIAARRSYWGARLKVQRRIDAVSPDIVHSMYGGVMAEIVTRASGRLPVVVSFCGSDLLGEPASTIVRRVAIRLGVWASHVAASRADAIIVKSQNLRDALGRHIDSRRVWTIANGVDMERFRPMSQSSCREKLGWRPDVAHVLFPSFAGHPRKRFPLARAAVDLLRASGIDIELHELQMVQHEDIPTWLNASDCVILTSVNEGSPNIVKEALACDRPVVSVDVGDVRERLEGIPGCFVTDATPEDLSEKLRRVLESSARRVDGRVRVHDLALERVAERLLDVYRTVLEDFQPSEHQRFLAPAGPKSRRSFS